jgi:hypothetical protein
MRARTLLLACLLFGGVPASALAQSRAVLLVLPAPSSWKSQSGTLDVTSVSNGVIQGTFTSSATSCGQIPSPVTGKVVSQKITFAAIFPACKMIMAWRGKVAAPAMATGLTTTSIQPDGTVSSATNGNLFVRTK